MLNLNLISLLTHKQYRTVYGTLLNHRDALAALGAQVNTVPYKVPPVAPVLYIKPRNTWVGHEDVVVVPADAPELEIGAALGVVIGRTACKVSVADAMNFVAGYTIVNDISVPHASYYRPSMRFKCRDTFCPIGPIAVPREALANPNAVEITVALDGEVVQRSSTTGLIRPVAQLLADGTDFMTLRPGGILSIGVAAGSPRARAGQRVTITVDGIGQLENVLAAEVMA